MRAKKKKILISGIPEFIGKFLKSIGGSARLNAVRIEACENAFFSLN